MRKKSLLLGLIFSFLGFAASAQIITKYSVGFEPSGENSSYTVVSGQSQTSLQTSLALGSRALKINHGSSDVVIVTDTIDLSDNGQVQYFFLEFMHVCDIDPLTTASASNVCYVEYRLPEAQNNAWTRLTGNNCYDMTWGGGSNDFQQNNSFSNRSYELWQTSPIGNTWWKKERFNLTNQLYNLALINRKVQFRFTVKARTASGTTTTGWYLDNITFLISPESMTPPRISMKTYPDLMDYPTNRATRIEAKVTTPAYQGICADSVYLLYQLGTNQPTQRAQMTSIGNNTYRGLIPFCGYDTIVKYRMVAKDATVNHNEVTFPLDNTSWNTYRSVRGYANNQPLATEYLNNETKYMFPAFGIHRGQFIYDSVAMAAAGYRPGAITQLQFTLASSANHSSRDRFQIVMKNLDPSFSVPVTRSSSDSSASFYTEWAKIVYDSSLVLNQNSGTIGTIYLQDTFFYAGKDLLVQVTTKNNSSIDPSAVAVKCAYVPWGIGKESVWTEGYEAFLGFDPWNNNLFTNNAKIGLRRPNFNFRTSANLPLIYDCGISGFITPNDSTSADANGNNNVVLTLKNYGVTPINAVRIYYRVDNQPDQFYDWTGTLAPNATTSVTVSTTQQYLQGYHEMLAWVADSVTCGSGLYRDHEPLNDTCWTRFVSCSGPLSGIVQVGGSTPDYGTLDEFLYAVSQCGVNAPLTVKLAPGNYQPTVFPAIPGSSHINYVQFEPLSGTVQFLPKTSGATSNNMLNLQNVAHVRFKNIKFTGYSASTTYDKLTYFVRMGINSRDCQFINCEFREETGTAAMANTFTTALIYSGGADSLVVDRCSFYRGAIGVSLVGPASDNLAKGGRIFGSTFTSQQTNSVVIRNQQAAVVDSNYMNDVLTNSSYLILLQDCYGATKVTRNKVYSTTGSSCIGATDMYGTSSNYGIIANNMLVSADDGTSNMLVTPLNIITADYVKVVYNAVKLTAPQRAGIAAATLGGGVIDHCYFFNNIVGCFDTTNFAFSYIPNAGNVNYIGYNIYYSQGAVLNKYNSISCLNLAQWQGHYSDPNSQAVNPAYLGGDQTDLRSYSQNVKEHGVAIPEVTNDLYGTTRSTTAPCIGAFEFSSLPYDFEVYALQEPFAEYCNVPANVPLIVAIRNTGVNAFDPTAGSNLTLSYARNNHPGQFSATNSGNVTVNVPIPGGSTVIFNTGHTVQIPTNGIYDTSYNFSFWLTSSLDPNPANDSSVFSVISHYHYPAPDSLSATTNYGTTATLNPTGLQTWYSNVYTSGRQHKSTAYWYASPTDETPFYIGNSYTTDVLYHDTLFYIRQRRDFPLVKISEVQIKNANVDGVTYPLPLWMNSATTFAIELTNIGDVPADMTGDTIHIISPTNSFNNKYYVFPQVTIQPGACLVLQYRTGINNVDSSKTIATTTLSPNYNTNFAILYRDGDGIVDAVAFNAVTSTGTAWSSNNVPATVWAGDGITLTQTNAGVIRTGFPTVPNSTPYNTAQYWQLADSAHRMTIGTVNSNLLRYYDNGCLGDYTTARVHLLNVPNVDLALDSLTIEGGCGLGTENVTATIHNFGAQNSGAFNVYYSVNDVLVCTDNIPAGLDHLQTINHTFSIPYNFYVASGEQNFDIKVWVDHVTGDNTIFNDSTAISITSYYTPAAPNVYAYDTVDYASRATLHAVTTPSDSLAWYDRNMNPLDTTNVYVSPILYVDDTFYVSAFGPKNVDFHVGTLASVNAVGAYPSPYNPKKKYVKEQYLFTAEQLREAGHGAGPINAVSFYLDSIFAPSGTMTFTDYTVAIGSTAQTNFTANNNWQTVTQVFNAPSLTITNAQKGWIRHDFTAPFVWDGTSSIVVEICRTINPAISQGARCAYTTALANQTLSKNDDATTTIATFTGNGARSANRPDILFGFVDYGCEGPTTPVYVTVVGTPDVDASVEWPIGDGGQLCSCGPTNIDVVLKNQGDSVMSNCQIDYWIDDNHGVLTSVPNIAAFSDTIITVASPSFTPGRHFIRVAVTAHNDTVHVNDTISTMINVGFCAGTYTIGPAASNDFHTFAAAIDTLTNAGVCGPVVFNVQSGTYNEQLNIGAVNGTSGINTITFRSATGNRNDVVIRYAPTNTANYVLNMDGASNVSFEKMTIYAAGTGNFSNAVTLANGSNIHFTDDYIHVKGTINNNNASCMIVGEGVQHLYIDTCTLDSGYYSVRSMVTLGGIDGTTYGMYFSDNQFQNFWSQGIYLRKVNDVYIRRNQITSGVSVTGRALTGVYIAEHEGGVTIERNNIVVSDAKNGGKQAIHMVNVKASNALRSKIYDNMCAAYGIGTTGQIPAGIWIDSCDWVNVYFNSARVQGGANAPTSCAFTVRTTSTNIFALNNIFANYSGGYAIYVQNPVNISNTNYNDYYATGGNANSVPKFAFWGVDNIEDLDALKLVNGLDVNSTGLTPYFVSSQDLHLNFGVFCEMGQYSTEVPTDIDGKIRPQIPSPCIGAHEPDRTTHDISVMDVITPTVATDFVEGDTLKIKVRLYNDGTSVESFTVWNAQIFSYPDSLPYTGLNLSTGNRTIDEHASRQQIVDSASLYIPYGVYDTNYIRVVYHMTTDAIPHNDTLWVPFYVSDAYNLNVTPTTVLSGDGCRLQNTQIQVNVTNVGRKDIPSNLDLNIGYQAVLQTAGVTIAQLPLVHNESSALSADLPVNASEVLTFQVPANLYPTNTAKDIVVRVRAWAKLQYDHRPANDTSAYVNVTSKYTPSAPVGTDLHIPYATWDTIFATHTDVPPTGADIHRPIRWYRDSLDEPYFANSNYARSCWWETPQYFHDSVYFLSCISTTGCTSYYSPVHVYLNPRVSADVSLLQVVEPYSKVYMNNDTVKVDIINYGNSPITNIPVVYQFFNNSNQLLQEVHEVCHATIQPDEVYRFKFDSLVITPNQGTYKLRAWTNLSNDQVRLNDTIRNIYMFMSMPENTYCNPEVANLAGIDITRVAWSSLDHKASPVGKDYYNFGQINSPAAEPLHIIKGTTDTMYIETQNSDDFNDRNTTVFLTAFIDYDRNGYFTYPGEMIFADTTRSGRTTKFVYTYPTDLYVDNVDEEGVWWSYPSNVCLGNMRMRIIAQQNGFERADGCPSFDFGQVQDYLLYVEDVPPTIDVAASRIVSPRDNFIEEDSTTVVFMMSNKGSQPITSTQIAYAFIDDSCTAQTAQGVLDWTGNLMPGQSVPVELPARHLITGTTNVKICINTPGDTLTNNDTLRYQYHRFKWMTLILRDDFERNNIWYAPVGYNQFTQNYWEREVPHKVNIQNAHSDSVVWSTNSLGFIIPGDRGNLSMLYSPIINISQIRPDTISFWLATQMSEDMSMRVEYYNYLGEWITVGSANDTLWYNDGAGFVGSTSGSAYEYFRFPTSRISGEFQQRLQFRVVFHAKPGAAPCDGVALDDFTIGRAQRAVDVGVIQITHPTHPKFGQTIYPKVAIKNFGFDTIYSVNLAYRPYGSNLPKTGTWTSENGLAPGQTTLYTFNDPFIVRNDFPDTFQICAYTTVNMDIYWENDSLCKDFYLSPLDNDMGMVQFMSPLDQIVAGDSITVTTRIRNYGMSPVSSTNVTYIFNNGLPVTETINFQDYLGHDLGSFEYFNYSFHRKCRASMGVMHMTAYTEMTDDDYLFNDTIVKSFNGISAITDLAAISVCIDTSVQNGAPVMIEVRNVGARAAYDFEVGYWYDNDTSTLFRKSVHMSRPLAALRTAYITLDSLPQRPGHGYPIVKGYVTIANDNDPSNDTTEARSERFTDLRVVRALVEENREDSCFVRVEIENVGNMPYTNNVRPTLTINGVTMNNNFRDVVYAPGEITTLNWPVRILKSPTRTYTGSVSIGSTPNTPTGDFNPDNNQSSVIDVVNYFDIDTPDAMDGLSLEQNYPNPFITETDIEFHIPYSGIVTFFVVDELGRSITRETSYYSEGSNTINFSDRSLSTGVYYYGIEFEGHRLMRKMVVKK